MGGEPGEGALNKVFRVSEDTKIIIYKEEIEQWLKRNSLGKRHI